jgi:NADPH:quinone reductase-like Zn-dependent oxidoreductase
MKTMKAIIQKTYGEASTLRIAEVAKPNPKPGEVLIKVAATSLNAPDWRLLKGSPFIVRLSSGLFKPKHLIKGTDFSGVVVELGSGVNRIKVGDAVYGDLADAGFGAFAEFVCAKEEVIALKPKSLNHLEAAALPLTAVTALQGLRNVGAVQAGERVLIIGASGGVGSYAVQLAKYFGAFVTGVTGSKHVEQAKKLGADAVVDYSVTPLETLTGKFDLVIAINGYNSLSTYRKLMAPDGRFVMVGGKSMLQILQVTAFGGMLSKKGGQTFKGLLAKPNAVDLGFIAQLVDEGKLAAVIEREIAFEDIPKALAELEKGHTGGKIVAWVREEHQR